MSARFVLASERCPGHFGMVAVVRRLPQHGRSAKEVKIFHAIRFGNDASPDGPNGEDTHFLVRAKDRTQAARMVDKYLRRELPHRKVDAKCHRIQELGRDTSSIRKPAIVAGPWYAILPCQIEGYTVWAREVHTGYHWVDAHKWFQGETSRTRKSTVRLRRP